MLNNKQPLTNEEKGTLVVHEERKMSQISIPHSDNNVEQFRCQRFTHSGVSH